MKQTAFPTVVDLNDSEIRLTSNGEIKSVGPGCAVIDGNDIYLGHTAAKQAHLKPRSFFNQFWYQLNESALPQGGKAARHQADLVYRHLSDIARGNKNIKEVIFAVSNAYTNDQLAMLLGISEACKIQTRGLVNSALMSAVGAEVACGEYQYVDLELHRCVITDIEINKLSQVTNGHSIEAVSAEQLTRDLVDTIADQFLDQARFDPLEQAETEQYLFDNLALWLRTLTKQSEVRASLDFRRQRFNAVISRPIIAQAIARVFAPALDRLDRNKQTLTSFRCRPYIDIADTNLALPGRRIVDATAVFDGIKKYSSQILQEPGKISLTRQLQIEITSSPGLHQNSRHDSNADSAADKAAGNLGAVEDSPKQHLVTHLLIDATAFPVSSNPSFLNQAGELTTTNGSGTVAELKTVSAQTQIRAISSDNQLIVNGSATHAIHLLNPGDVITFTGNPVSITAITVADHDAS